jgi:hypothetical protein
MLKINALFQESSNLLSKPIKYPSKITANNSDRTRTNVAFLNNGKTYQTTGKEITLAIKTEIKILLESLKYPSNDNAKSNSRTIVIVAALRKSTKLSLIN